MVGMTLVTTDLPLGTIVAESGWLLVPVDIDELLNTPRLENVSVLADNDCVLGLLNVVMPFVTIDWLFGSVTEVNALPVDGWLLVAAAKLLNCGDVLLLDEGDWLIVSVVSDEMLPVRTD